MRGKKIVLAIILLTFVMVIGAVYLPLGKMKVVEANTGGYVITLHSNYPDEWGMEQVEKKIQTDEDGNVFLDGDVFECGEENKIIRWRNNPSSYYRSTWNLGDNTFYKNEDLYVEWGMADMPQITVHSNYPAETGLAEKTEIVFADGWSWEDEVYGLYLQVDFQCDTFYMDGYKDKEGNFYKYSDYNKFKEDTELYTNWKEKSYVIFHEAGSHWMEDEEDYIYYFDDGEKILVPDEYSFYVGIEYIADYWYTSDGKKYYPGFFYKLDSGTELFPHWVEKQNIKREDKVVRFHTNYPQVVKDKYGVNDQTYKLTAKEGNLDMVGYVDSNPSDYTIICSRIKTDSVNTICYWETEDGQIYKDNNNYVIDEELDLYAHWSVCSLYFQSKDDNKLTVEEEYGTWEYTEYRYNIPTDLKIGNLDFIYVTVDGKKNTAWKDEDGNVYPVSELEQMELTGDLILTPVWEEGKHIHQWDKGTVVTAATCEADGEMKYVCTICGEELTETIPAVKHIDKILFRKEATCEDTGLTMGRTCAICGKVFEKQEIIPALGHNYFEVGGTGKAATCTEPGRAPDKKCEMCQKVIQGDEIPAQGHNEITIPEVPARCTVNGLTEQKYCSKCRTVLVEAEEIPPLGHDFGEWVTEKQPSCTEKGYERRYCKRDGCNGYETNYIDAIGHTEVDVPREEATCEKAGNTAGKKCSTCGEILEGVEEIPAKGHDWDDGIITKEATCTEKGSKICTCSRCKKTKTFKIAAKGHTVVKDPAIEATTTTTGLTEGSHCSVCGATLKKQEIVPVKEDTEAQKKAEEEAKNKAEEDAKKSVKTNYKDEWINGKWYDSNGVNSYTGILEWRSDGTGWWVQDSDSWYPADLWQKIDGVWYYFKPDGYMAANEYYNGYWFNKDGSWDPQYNLKWMSNASGWWVEDLSGWWPANSWLKIDGCWYYFDGSGYMVSNQYVDGYWIGADGVCR